MNNPPKVAERLRPIIACPILRSNEFIRFNVFETNQERVNSLLRTEVIPVWDLTGGHGMNHRIVRFTILLPVLWLLKPAVLQTKRIQNSDTQNSGTKPIEIQKKTRYDCLPPELKPTDVVSFRKTSKSSDETITIEQKLVELGAQCRDGELIDGKGKAIGFFRIACFGNPPADDDEIARREQAELEKLQKDHTVIVFECDPRIQ